MMICSPPTATSVDTRTRAIGAGHRTTVGALHIITTTTRVVTQRRDKYIRMTEDMADSDGWITDGSCGEGWVEPPDFDDWCCRESGYFTPNISNDSDVEEGLSYGDGRRARTSMLTPPLPKSPPSTSISIDSSSTTTPPQFSLYHEVSPACA